MKKSFTINVDLDELMGDFIPKIVNEFIRIAGPVEEFKGTEFTLTADISDVVYSYIAKDGGSEFTVKKGKIESPMIYFSMSVEDVERIIQLRNIDLLLGIRTDQAGPFLSMEKYKAASSLKGSFRSEIDLPDGNVIAIETVLNGAAEPKSVFKISMENVVALMKKETNPVNLFMSGAMKIEGDIAFAMSTQPLFS